MSDFERYAVDRLLSRARELGVDAPRSLASFVCGGGGSAGARAYAAAHPELIDEDGFAVPDAICCSGVGFSGRLEDCGCWQPVYEPAEQATPRPPASAADLRAQSEMCSDCAFRKDSPERSTEFEEEALLSLPEEGQAFWCHDGMRRPVRWVHPTRGEIDGDPADWRPPQVGGIPYRADGAPGLLCAGWLARRVRAVAREQTRSGVR